MSSGAPKLTPGSPKVRSEEPFVAHPGPGRAHANSFGHDFGAKIARAVPIPIRFVELAARSSHTVHTDEHVPCPVSHTKRQRREHEHPKHKSSSTSTSSKRQGHPSMGKPAKRRRLSAKDSNNEALAAINRMREARNSDLGLGRSDSSASQSANLFQ